MHSNTGCFLIANKARWPLIIVSFIVVGILRMASGMPYIYLYKQNFGANILASYKHVYNKSNCRKFMS